MKSVAVVAVVAVFCVLGVCDAARILGVFPVSSVSHQIVYRALMRALHGRGHEVVVLTTNPTANLNLTGFTEIDLSRVYDYWKERYDFAGKKDQKPSPEAMMADFMESANDICEIELSHPDVQKLIANNTTNRFDLIMMEWVIFPCMYGFQHIFNVPMIGVVSHGAFLTGYDAVGNPAHPAYCPDVFLPYTDHLSFIERFHSTLYNIWYRYKWHFYVLPHQDAIARRHFGTTMPYLGDIERNVSMVFVNSHFTLHVPRPNVPAVIEMGGLHIRKPQQVKGDLLEWLEGSGEGVIYFSLGSNVRSDRMPSAKRQMFLDAFSELPHRVLWKWESDTLPGQPANVKLGKWLPQQDILAHPKVRVFITQGGLQSTEEAVHAGVPMVGMPFMADQGLNVRKMVAAGVSVHLDFPTLTKEAILNALHKVLTEPSYRRNMERLSRLVKDQPETSIERAIWWTEYVLRHNGATHLRSAAADMPWYQYLLLDVIAAMALALLFIGYVIFKVARTVCKKLIVTSSHRPKND